MLIDIHKHCAGITERNTITICNCIIGKDKTPEGFFSAGIHPWYLDTLHKQFDELRTIAQLQYCKAIGECGIDKVCNTSLHDQEKAFRMQCSLAFDLQKPLIVHAVKSHFDCIKIINEFGLKKVIFHGFNNRYTILEKILENDFYVSFGEHLFDNRSQANALFSRVDLSRIFLETDESICGIETIYKKASELYKIEFMELSNKIKLNYNNVFE